jgi:hypothetical protein
MALAIRGADPHGALRHIEMALDSDPNLIDALELRALVRARLGKPEALDDVDRLAESPTCQRLYNAACAVAVYVKEARDSRPLRHGLELLARALESGFPARDAATDPDLDSMRELPDFARILARNTPQK